MPQFSPDQVTFKDIAGYGGWDIGHARGHIQYVQVLAQQTPAILIPDFDLLNLLTAGTSRKSQVDSHAQAHNLLRQITGVQGVDLTQFNLDDENDFYNFMGYHATEEAEIRHVLGIT